MTTRAMHTTLPRQFYADPEFYRAELERFYFKRWICAGRADQIPDAGRLLHAQRSATRASSSRATRSGDDSRALQRVPPSRHAAVRADRRAFRRSHPVPVSRLDVRPRRQPARRAAHGAGLPQGGLPAPSRRLRGVGRPHLRAPRRRTARPLRRSARAICPSTLRERGRWATSGSAGASSTTSRRTGS